MGRGWYLDYMGGSLNVFRHTWYSLSTVYHLFWLVPLNIILLLGLKIKILHHLVPLASLSSTLYLFWLHVFNSSLDVLSSIPAGPCPWDILSYLSHTHLPKYGAVSISDRVDLVWRRKQARQVKRSKSVSNNPPCALVWFLLLNFVSPSNHPGFPQWWSTVRWHSTCKLSPLNCFLNCFLP